ncbi:putative thiazole-containing bacteriocin maturation protein [Priestia megaterium]|nr:putative thiazole-containing bacteriocin maturation protein [Priestia megaterium]
MTTVNASTRLKVKRDTFFLPDPAGGVYFRNNSSSFRLKGNTIYQWIEKLIPMFNGEHSLGELTYGLPAPYQNRVYEIGELLYQNDFAHDVSQDRPHQLESSIVQKYASQIEFLENFIGSPAFQFQRYRQANVLAVGSGPFFISLVSALLESGLPKFHIVITNSMPTNQLRLKELIENASKTDLEVNVAKIIIQKEDDWEEVVQPFESVLYVSEEENTEELRALHAVCRKEKKTFIPAVMLQTVGLAGPIVHPDSEECWESAWRRIHSSVIHKEGGLQKFSSTAGAMLANVIVFELFKNVTGVNKSKKSNEFFLLDLELLEGDWHSFLKHPFAGTPGHAAAELVENLDRKVNQQSVRDHSSGLFGYFNQLTSPVSGIFHKWEEGDLKQLPLSQCGVQVANPLSDESAELLPQIVCSGLTHEEARREAGLTGIEQYVSQMKDVLFMDVNEEKNNAIALQQFIGVGAGETAVEAVCRGLQKCLDDELNKRTVHQKESIFRVQLDTIEDEKCSFYLQALATLQETPIIGLGQKVLGFPVVWIGINKHWYKSAGLTVTAALQRALQQAIMDIQNQMSSSQITAFNLPSDSLIEAESTRLALRNEERTDLEIFQSATQILKRNNRKLVVFDLAAEAFLKEGLAGVYGVLLREEKS